MRPFNWVALLDKHRVEYVDRGANVKRGEINIRCPWCGSADPSHHLGINLENGWYSCWRNRSGHSGKSPLRLIMALLRVSYWQAREIAGLSDDYVDPEGFDAVAARVMGRQIYGNDAPKIKREFIEMDPSFRVITDEIPTRRWWNYLWQRGFDDPTAAAELYHLRAARNGDFSTRVILPYFLDGCLVTWTGRAIARSDIRYRDLSPDESIVAAKDTLYNHDAMVKGGNGLVIVEGPFDALKLDYYGRRFGVRAVALSTNSVSDQQAYMLEEHAGKFKDVSVMMDNKSGFGLVDSMKLKQRIPVSKAHIVQVPFGRGDAGELTGAEVRDWAAALVEELP